MNEHPDPYELLRELNPVDASELADAAESAPAHQGLSRILSERQRPRRPWRIGALRRRTYVLAAVALTAGAATAAWALTQGATKHLAVGCYASASLDASTVVVAAGAAQPTQLCRAVWARGDFGTQQVPRLQACILPSGSIGVFPSPTGTACNDLKLAEAAPPQPTTQSGPTKTPGSTVELKDALVEKFLARGCIPERPAKDIVRNEFQRLRLSDWRVQANGTFTSARPCASLAFDEERHLVLLTPMPNQP